ncbi:MAG: class I SAM-dependent methyltransferase [Myxococcota bacterium]
MSDSFWDARYGEPGFAYGDAPNDFLASVVDRLTPGPALCLAEGEGRNAVFLAERGFEVTAVDQSRVGLRKAEALAAQRGVKLRTVVADLAHYVPAAQAYHAVVLIWCHLPPSLRRTVHAAAVAALRPGGAVVLEAYSPAQLALGTGGPRSAELMFTLAELREDFAGIELAVAEEKQRHVHEGRYHDGPSAVVQVLGFRR